MNENSTDTELLIQYMDGELAGAQLEKIIDQLRENAGLREELENLQLAREAMKTYGLKSKIGDIHKEMMPDLKEIKTPKTGTVKMIFQTSLRIAAVLIVLLGASALYQYLTVTPGKLFDESFSPYQIHNLRDGSTQSALKSAYLKGDADSVILFFHAGNSLQPEDYLMAGITFLNIKQPGKAIDIFNSLIQKNSVSKTDQFEDDAEYYLAESYLQNNQPEKAVPIFEKIQADHKHDYNSRVSRWFMLKLRTLHK